AVTIACGQPHLADATRHLVSRRTFAFRELGKRFSEFDDIAVPLFPVVEQGEVVEYALDRRHHAVGYSVGKGSRCGKRRRNGPLLHKGENAQSLEGILPVVTGSWGEVADVAGASSIMVAARRAAILASSVTVWIAEAPVSQTSG